MACHRCTLHRASRRCVAQRPPRGHPSKVPLKGVKNNWIPAILARPASLARRFPPSQPLEIVLSRSDLAFSGVLAASLSESSPTSQRTAALADPSKGQRGLPNPAPSTRLPGRCCRMLAPLHREQQPLDMMCDGCEKDRTTRAVSQDREARILSTRVVRRETGHRASHKRSLAHPQVVLAVFTSITSIHADGLFQKQRGLTGRRQAQTGARILTAKL